MAQAVAVDFTTSTTSQRVVSPHLHVLCENMSGPVGHHKYTNSRMQQFTGVPPRQAAKYEWTSQLRRNVPDTDVRR